VFLGAASAERDAPVLGNGILTLRS
jgi:hypothetical protein